MTILLAVVLLGIAAPAPQDWKKIENHAFSFSLPSNFKQTEARGIDSFVEEYSADSILISFDLGRYSDDFRGWPSETKFENVKVGERPARIGTAMRENQKGFLHSTQIHIKLDGAVALSMHAACKTEKEVTLAKRIFETIVIHPKKP